MVLSGVGFTVYLLLNKLLSSDVHPVVLAFWRALIGMMMAIPFVAMIGFSKMKTKRPGILLLRSLSGTLAPMGRSGERVPRRLDHGHARPVLFLATGGG